MLPQGPSGESELQSNSPSFKSFLSVYAEKAHASFASFWDTWWRTWVPPLQGGAGHTSSKRLASSHQVLKLSTAHSTVASEGAPSQGVHSAWSELPTKHTVDLEALGANPSDEELPDIYLPGLLRRACVWESANPMVKRCKWLDASHPNHSEYALE